MDKQEIKAHFQIDKNSPIPMYFQLKQTIKASIENHTFNTGDQLPTELEICDALDVSRPTIRQALQELINEGFITRKKAKGTFVNKPKVDGFFFKKLASFNEEMIALGLKPKTDLMTQKLIKADAIIADALQIEEGEFVLYLERLRYGNENPIVYVKTYVPIKMFPAIDQHDFSDHHDSLYNLFNEHYHHPISYVDRSVEVANCSNKLSKMLKCQPNDAVYVITTHAYDDNDVPVEYSKAIYNGELYKFSIRLVKQ